MVRHKIFPFKENCSDLIFDMYSNDVYCMCGKMNTRTTYQMEVESIHLFLNSNEQ